MITHPQLVALGYSDKAIKHRIRRGRLHVIHRGVYAVGRRELTREGEWMAAVLACGKTAALSHESAAVLSELAKAPTHPIHVSVLVDSRSRKGIVAHRRTALKTTTHEGIAATTPAETLIDVASIWNPSALEQAIGEAAFRVTQSELEREFLRLVRRAGLETPETQHRLDETDGGRFHRSALQQTRDRRRDQAHLRAGRTPVRVTHAQVFFDAAETTALLVDVFTGCQWRRESRSS